MTVRGYADVEAVLVGWLGSELGVRVVTELPAILPAEIIRVSRFGGGRAEFPFDVASVDVDTFAATRRAAIQLGERVAFALMYDLPGLVSGGAIVLAAECVSAPSWAPYDNTNVRRSIASYRIRTHNPL